MTYQPGPSEKQTLQQNTLCKDFIWENYIHSKISTGMYTAALFNSPQMKMPKYLSKDKQINEMVYPYNRILFGHKMK